MRQIILVVLTLAVSLFAQTGTPPSFTITDLGAINSSDASAATAISPTGLVAMYSSAGGFSLVTGGSAHAVLYDSGNLKDLGSLGGQANLPLAVNDAATVTGVSGVFGFTIATSPFLFQNGALQTLAGTSTSNVFPFGINNAGQIAATSGFRLKIADFPDLSAAQAVIITNGIAVTLPSPQGAASSIALEISPKGRVAGASMNSITGAVLPTIWTSGAPATFPRPQGFPSGLVASVNDAGRGVGALLNYTLPNIPDTATAHAVIFENGQSTDIHSTLPTASNSSVATGVNNSGWVIGISGPSLLAVAVQLISYLPADSAYRPFLFANGRSYDLNSLAVNGAAWSLCFAAGINDAGQIVGTGFLNGQQRAFLMTPITTASSPSIQGIVGAGLGVPAVQTLSPGALFTIFGSNFAASGTQKNAGSTDIVGNRLPQNLANTCVQVGPTRAPLTFVSAGQINAQMPSVGVSGMVPVSVIANCGLSNQATSSTVNVALSSASPELLSFVQNPDGKNPVAAVNATGGFVGPAGLLNGLTFTPARANDVVTVFAIGLGATTPIQVPGALADGPATINGTMVLQVGGVQAPVMYAGITPTFAGLYQINFVVPTGLPPGNAPITIAVNGIQSPTGPFLAVKP